jgi:transcriptional regulator with XRE-family HTH domain
MGDFVCYVTNMISPEQSRAARGWLDWSQEDLAKRANTSMSTIRDFEKGRRVPIRNNLEAIRLSFEMVGISFLFRGEVPIGIQVMQRLTAP